MLKSHKLAKFFIILSHVAGSSTLEGERSAIKIFAKDLAYALLIGQQKKVYMISIDTKGYFTFVQAQLKCNNITTNKPTSKRLQYVF